MSQFSVKATFDGADLVKGFKDVKKEVEGLESVGENAKKSLDQMLQQKNSTSNYRRQLAMLTKELTDLTVNYRALSDAEKQSEFGQALSQRIDELSAKAAEFKDAMLDVQQSINKSASDTANWDAFSSMIDITTSSLQTFVGVTGMSAESTEALTKTIVTLQTVGAASNAMIKIGNALQKQSALMLGVRRTQELAAATAIKLKTAAEVKGKVATVAATAAQKAFNVVANANPYVLLATAIIGVGAALYGFIKSTNNAEKEQEEYNKKVKEAEEREKHRRDTIGNAVGDVISKYKLLQVEWQNLSNTQERDQWIKDNASAFDDLGLSINNITDAQKVLVDNAPKVVKALMLQAEAAALTDLYKESYKEAYTRAQEIDNQITDANQRWVSGASFSGSELQKYNIQTYERTSTYHSGVYDSTPNTVWGWIQKSLLGAAAAEGAGGIHSYTEYHNNVNSQGAERIRKQVVSGLEAEREAIMAESDAILEDVMKKQEEALAAQAEAAAFKPRKTNTSTSTVTPKTLEDETAAYVKAIAEQEDLYKKGFVTYQEYLVNKKNATDRYANAIVALDGEITEPQAAQLRNAQALSNSYQNLISVEQQRIKLENDKAKNLSDFAETAARSQELEKEGLLDSTEAREQQIAAAKKYYNFLTANWENLSDQEKETAKSIKATIDAYENAKTTVPRGKSVEYRETKVTEANEVLAKFDAGVITRDVAQKAIDDINADLQSLELKPIPIDLDLEHFNTQMDQAMQLFDAFGSLGSVVSNVNGIYESFMNLGDAMDEAKNGWEEFMVGFELGMQIMNAVVGLMGTINTIMETFTMIQEMVTAAKLKDTAASTAKAGADTASATAATAVATADAAAAAATTTKATTDAAATAAAGTKAGADTAAAVASTAVATADTAAAAASGAKATTDVAGAAAAGTKAAADVAGAAASSTAAAANTAAAVTGAAQSVSWMPIVGPILAVAAIAAVIGGIMAAMNKGKFASGGIVPGPSKIGDFNIARVNGGEMILNTRQQANLFNMLDHNRVNDTSSAPQNVSFRIQGDTLVGVIDNYNKKRGRI